MRKPLSLILVLSSVAVLDSFVWLESAAQPAKSQGAGGEPPPFIQNIAPNAISQTAKGLKA